MKESLDAISQHVRHKLLTRGFIPLLELEDHPDCPPWFSLSKAKKRALALQKNIADFFYSPCDVLEPYIYYNDLALVAFSPDDPDLARCIDEHEKACRNALQSLDFTALFDGVIDQRIALTAYQHLFHLIPDEQKYDLFLHVYCRSESGYSSFPEEIVRQAALFRKNALALPGVGRDGFVDLYRGMSHLSTPIDKAFSWTLSLRTAILFAVRFRLDRKAGTVYKISVHQDKVVAYITDRKEDEIIVLPSDIREELKKAEIIQVIGLKELESKLDMEAITKEFDAWSLLVNPEHFRNPFGIHGTGHTKRVLFLCLVLAHINGLAGKDLELLCKVSLYHDIGRTHDGVDSLHGTKSYQKVKELGLLSEGDAQDQQLVQFIFENHCVDDKKAKNNLARHGELDQERSWFLLSLFKDADGLDRVRLRDLDPRQLRTPKAKELILLAEQLLERIKS